MDSLRKKGVTLDTMRIRAFPFHESVSEFINSHERVFVIDQNRDAQLKSLLKIECNANEEQMQSILNYNGVLITAQTIEQSILDSMPKLKKPKKVPA